MNEYLKETKMLNFTADEITTLIHQRRWQYLSEYDKIGATYDFVRNEILFGYNESDMLTASDVLKDGIGQCNTKATLLMALLRSVEIPCRLRGFDVSKDFQKGATSGLISILAPDTIIHTWVEVYYCGEWLALEGVIIDEKYLRAVKAKSSDTTAHFMKYAIATSDFVNLSLDWEGKATFVQSEAIVHDYGVFNSPDEFFINHSQKLKRVKQFLYSHIGRRIMTYNVQKIRNHFYV